ncbi:CAP domain-containing protein [Trametes polyzona]|nr:CAP domain-containing protein [Trametes polyzona]
MSSAQPNPSSETPTASPSSAASPSNTAPASAPTSNATSAAATTSGNVSSASTPTDVSTTTAASGVSSSLSSSAASSSGSISTGAPLPAPIVGSAQKQIYLDQHNAVRQQFKAQPLTWSDDLQSKAQGYAERCQLRHSDGALGPVGENLAAATGRFDIAAAVQLFVHDKDQFDPNHFVFSHFTQVVWKSTTQLGCGVAFCDNIFPGRKGPATYHVCLYDPVGNVVGQEK